MVKYHFLLTIKVKITLVQPRHIYAPNNNDIGHIYMPTSLLSVAARLIGIGVSVNFFDENISIAKFSSDPLGINVIGAPYIGAAIEILNRYNINESEGIKIVGGQGVRGLSEKEFSSLFGTSTIFGNNSEYLKKSLMLDYIPHEENISLIPAYKILSDKFLKHYLSTEFCFYLSQGCKFQCTFCAAERSNSKRKSVSESYRNVGIAYNDLLFLCEKAQLFGLCEINIYLSNLDLFQTPKLLLQFAEAVLAIKKKIPSVNIRIRGLATVYSFLMCDNKQSHVIRIMVDAGLERIGFGIDGATPLVWKAVKKPQSDDKCIEAIMTASQKYGLIPESLMVFGHNEADNEQSLNAAIQFVDETRNKFNSIPRPHVAKNIIPGNDGWIDPTHKTVVDYLIKNPSAFQMLDFTTLPSWLTHPNNVFRKQVTEAFLAICNFENSLTKYTLAEDLKSSREDFIYAKTFNLGRYDV